MKKPAVFITLVVLVVLAAYRCLILYDNQFPYGRMWETPAVRPHEEPMRVMETGSIPFKGGEALYRESTGQELISPLEKGNPKDIELGKAGYMNFCVHCHGKALDGMGTVGQSFSPLPSDLRTEWVQTQTDGKLFLEISFGIPKGRQPALATTIRPLDRWRIVAYIKSLGTRKPIQK